MRVRPPPAIVAPAPRQAWGTQRAPFSQRRFTPRDPPPFLRPRTPDGEERPVSLFPGKPAVLGGLGTACKEPARSPRASGLGEDEDRDPRGEHGEMEHWLAFTWLSSRAWWQRGATDAQPHKVNLEETRRKGTGTEPQRPGQRGHTGLQVIRHRKGVQAWRRNNAAARQAGRGWNLSQSSAGSLQLQRSDLFLY